jgi:uncharacterized protein (DUF1499 family)
MKFLAGARPGDLGVRDGRLRAVHWKPNHVSSQATPSDKTHYIKAIDIPTSADPLDVWEALIEAIRGLPHCNIVTEKRDYVHAEVKTAVLGFVDDLEIYLPPPMACIHIRSGARLGVRDFGVNRKRVEALRALCSK